MILAPPRVKELLFDSEGRRPNSLVGRLAAGMGRKFLAFVSLSPRRFPFAFQAATADVLVTGSNPLLLTLAVRRILIDEPKASVIVAPTRLPDPWEYQALELRPFRKTIERPLVKAFPELAEKLPAADSAAGWIRLVLRAAGGALPINETAELSLISAEAGFGFAPSDRRIDDRGALYLPRGFAEDGAMGWWGGTMPRSGDGDPRAGKGWPTEPRSGVAGLMDLSLEREALARLPLLGLDPKSAREPRLLVRRMIVVSELPGGFACEERPDDGEGRFERIPARDDVLLFGSAAKRCETGGIAMRQALLDVLELLDVPLKLRFDERPD